MTLVLEKYATKHLTALINIHYLTCKKKTQVNCAIFLSNN